MFRRVIKVVVQLGVLAAAVVIGILIAPSVSGIVNAEQSIFPAGSTAKAGGSRIVTLDSYSTSSALGTNVLLAHNLQAEVAVVGGYDIIKIDRQILNYLATLPNANKKALESIVIDSQADELYRLPTNPGVPARPNK